MTGTLREGIQSRALQLLGERWFYELGYYYLLTQAEFRASVKRLEGMQDRHAGERCFIIGNGPSLKNMDLAPLVNEVTFGLNRIYLLFPTLNFKPTYYVAVNKLVIQQCAAEIMARVPSHKFISYDARGWIDFGPDLTYLYSREGPKFYRDITKGIWQGATVTYTALQIAYFMGFKKVILIGVDHRYATSGRPHEEVISRGHDPDHFDDDYFGSGFRWQLPDLAMSECAYRLAKVHFEHAGREILDATTGGRLHVFPKVAYESLFA